MTRDFLVHLARTTVWSAALVLATTFDTSPALVAVLSTCLYLAAFAFAHDALHGALGLSRRGRDLALAVLGTLMLTSGHTMRLLHLRHHARPLAPDDVEGRGARRSLLGAILDGPATAWGIRRDGLRARHDRRWTLAENAANAVTLGLALAIPALRVPVAVALVLQLTASVWASHVPHRAPPWLVALAARGAVLGSPILLSLAHHDLHHARPGVPCRALGAA